MQTLPSARSYDQPAVEEFPETDVAEDCRAAKGILNGVLLGAAMWAVLLVLAFHR